MVTSLINLFSMDELLVENYEEKLQEIIEFCPFNCAVTYPPAGGNTLPRTVYCNNSLEPNFSCVHMGQVNIEIYLSWGKVKSYKKCATLTDRLHDLNKAGRLEEEENKGKGEPADK
jgi:hypothetical protein